ncbi:MAG: response regulator [Dehalococcoidia bacterium]
MDNERALTVMVVDQHKEVCAVLARSLERLPGIDVLGHATNLMLAAEVAHRLSPDVIVADFVWGEATRADILRWFGRMSPYSRLVVYSSYFRDGERESFEAAGATRCLLKGMNVKDLGAELRKVHQVPRDVDERRGNHNKQGK